MPSIPQSLLWISLVVLWLFVLVPMLVSKRDAVRRTSDVALATRVLNGRAAGRLLKRGGPAAGHRSDPDWQHEDSHSEDEWDDEPTEEHFVGAEGGVDEEREEEPALEHDGEADTDRPRPVVLRVTAAEPTQPDYLDVDVIEDSGALPAGVSALAEDSDAADEAALDEDSYEYVEDSSGLEPDDDEEDDGREAMAAVPAASRRRRFENKTAAAVIARKYEFRKRVLMVMAVVLVGSATMAFEVSSSAWWLCGTATAITVLYLAYLRRQTRIEERVRRRRMQRMARARLGVENTRDREYDVVPSRLRRPGAVVLEIDDEDPIFEHLDYAMAQRNYGWSRDLPRAVGQ